VCQTDLSFSLLTAAQNTDQLAGERKLALRCFSTLGRTSHVARVRALRATISVRHTAVVPYDVILPLVKGRLFVWVMARKSARKVARQSKAAQKTTTKRTKRMRRRTEDEEEDEEDDEDA